MTSFISVYRKQNNHITYRASRFYFQIIFRYIEMAAEDIYIRSFQQSDLPFCRSLLLDAHSDYQTPIEYFEEFAFNGDMVDIQKNYLDIPNAHWWVAVSRSNNEIVGQVSVQPLKLGDPKFYENAISEEYRDQTCELRRMAVSSKCQHQGVGNKLLGTLFSFARTHNYKKVHLTTLRFFTKACKFYEKNGFRPGMINTLGFKKESDNSFHIEPGKTLSDPSELTEEDFEQIKLPPKEAKYIYIQHYEADL